LHTVFSSATLEILRFKTSWQYVHFHSQCILLYSHSTEPDYLNALI